MQDYSNMNPGSTRISQKQYITRFLVNSKVCRRRVFTQQFQCAISVIQGTSTTPTTQAAPAAQGASFEVMIQSRPCWRLQGVVLPIRFPPRSIGLDQVHGPVGLVRPQATRGLDLETKQLLDVFDPVFVTQSRLSAIGR